jgi:8-oxo-dGTP pyrophosphatase MutT (NUDIX family)
MREKIASLIKQISPLDELEATHQQKALDWIASGADLFRVQKPDVPSMHLVSYFAIIDPKSHSILLQHHLLANLWLPAGGHVEQDEDPAITVQRECQEELGIRAEFRGRPLPHFVTVTQTVNDQKSHTDVSLWYTLQSDQKTPLTIEPNKFAEVKWWKIDDVLRAPIEEFDPQLHRFLKKIQSSVLNDEE